MKTPVIEDIDIDEIDDFFRDSYTTKRDMDEQINTLQQQLVKEQETINEMEEQVQALQGSWSFML